MLLSRRKSQAFNGAKYKRGFEMATFATRIKEQRLKKGLSQPQLAEDIGLTKQTISLWERGVRRPDFDTMVRLGDFFGVSVSYPVGQSDDPNVSAETAVWLGDEDVIGEIESLGSQLSQLSEESRKIVAATIREAYRVDREAGRLEEGYNVNVTAKKHL